MITMLMFDSLKNECKQLEMQARDSFAHQSEDELKVTSFQKIEQARQEINQGGLMDIAFLDVATPEGVSFCREVREKNELAQFLVIADASVSPMVYMTPEIRATTLLLRPFTQAMSQQVINQFFSFLYREQKEKDNDRKLVIENREGTISIPFSKIYYIEVSGKKIYVRLKDREYSRYDTMDAIVKQLPDNFIRCHRSFVVNTSFITKVKLSENTIYLEDDMMVPLARSFKADVKEFMNQGKKRVAENTLSVDSIL